MRCFSGNLHECLIAELNSDTVGSKIKLLANNYRAVRVQKNFVKIFDRQFFKTGNNRESADELTFKAITYKIFSLNMFEIAAGFFFWGYITLETDRLFLDSFFDDILKIGKGAAHDEQNIFCVYHPTLTLAGRPVMFNGFDLWDRIMGHLEIDLCFFHGF